MMEYHQQEVVGLLTSSSLSIWVELAQAQRGLELPWLEQDLPRAGADVPCDDWSSTGSSGFTRLLALGRHESLRDDKIDEGGRWRDEL